MKKKSNRKRKIVRSKDLNITVRSVRRAEPDYDKLAKALIQVAVERQRAKNPDSVKWYDERYSWANQDAGPQKLDD